MVTKSVNATVKGGSQTLTQEVYYCLAVGYSTPKRITDCNHDLWIDGVQYTARPGALQIPELVNSETANRITIRIFNDYDTATEFGQLDWAQDTAGKTVTVYRVSFVSGTQYNHTAWSGYARSFHGGPKRCEIFAMQEAGFRSRTGNRVCWRLCGFDWKDLNCEYDGPNTSCAYTLETCLQMVYLASPESVAGLNDCTSGIKAATSGYSGTAVVTYYVEVDDAVGDPNTFKWGTGSSYPPSSWTATGVVITGDAQDLSENVTVTFTSKTGHTLGDYWAIKAGNIDRYGGFAHIPPPGTVIEMGGVPSALQGPGGRSTGGGWWWSPPPTGDPTGQPRRVGGRYGSPPVDPPASGGGGS